MTRDFFDPPWEETKVALVDGAALRKAERLILGCEACATGSDADVPFDWILDLITGRDPRMTDYLLSEPAKCPKCKAEVREKTLVELDR
jgi:hypothetical protein